MFPHGALSASSGLWISGVAAPANLRPAGRVPGGDFRLQTPLMKSVTALAGALSAASLATLLGDEAKGQQKALIDPGSGRNGLYVWFRIAWLTCRSGVVKSVSAHCRKQLNSGHEVEKSKVGECVCRPRACLGLSVESKRAAPRELKVDRQTGFARIRNNLLCFEAIPQKLASFTVRPTRRSGLPSRTHDETCLFLWMLCQKRLLSGYLAPQEAERKERRPRSALGSQSAMKGSPKVLKAKNMQEPEPISPELCVSFFIARIATASGRTAPSCIGSAIMPEVLARLRVGSESATAICL